MKRENKYPTRSMLKLFRYYPTPSGIATMRRASERASCKKGIVETLDELEGGDLFALWHVAEKLKSEAQANAKPKNKKPPLRGSTTAAKQNRTNRRVSTHI